MMTSVEIAQRRLHNQHLAGASFEQPSDVVRWLGAVQAQDFAAALWAVGLRLHGATEATVEHAVADGSILRTHVLRPTWHFVTPTDIRWLLALTAPRVKATMVYYDRLLEVDDAAVACSNAALANALRGGKQLTRAEIALLLEGAGIAVSNPQRLGHLIMRAELDGVVCSGARRGKQFTYALLDERAPHAATLARDEALAALAKRYFTSHGPATLRDYVWWSGLAAADARVGLELAKPQLVQETVNGQTYWLAASPPPVSELPQTAYLLPNFDEYTVGYTDRSAVFAASHADKLGARANILFNHAMVLDGQIVGAWKRTLKKGAVAVALSPFAPLDDAATHAFATAAARYSAFVNLPVSLAWAIGSR